MGAFIVAGIVVLMTLALCALMLFASGMASAPSTSNELPYRSVFFIGMFIAALIAASHWLHISW